MNPSEKFPIGTRVRLRVTPDAYRAFKGLTGEILSVETGPVPVATINFDDGPLASQIGRDIPLAYLEPAPIPVTAEKRTRRPDGISSRALTLYEPPDDRTEDERMDEGVKYLTNRGYTVLQVGQSRTAAICHNCSRVSRANGGRGMVPIRCKVCNSLGYSPSTNSTAGTPDCFVGHDDWQLPHSWLGLEWKDGPQPGKLSDEQRNLRFRGRITVAWNLRTCLQAVADFEQGLDRYPHPDITGYLAECRMADRAREATLRAAQEKAEAERLARVAAKAAQQAEREARRLAEERAKAERQAAREAARRNKPERRAA